MDALQRVVLIREPLKRPAYFSYRSNGCSNLFRASKYCPARSYSADFLKRNYFVYDALQNKISETVTAFRWLTRFVKPKLLCKYDKAGNLVEKQEGETTTRYEYDPHHRQVMMRQGVYWERTLRTSTGLEYGTADSAGARSEKKFDSGGYEVTS